jgi:hypothetical protein
VSRTRTVTAEFIAELQARAQEQACPACGVVGAITIREKYIPRTLPDIVNVRVTYGPRGMPLIAWCGACNTGGRVGEVDRGGPPA